MKKLAQELLQYISKNNRKGEDTMEYAIAFIGYGEAAYHISRGLQSEKRVRMIAYDEMAEDAARGAKI